nr:MAG TPA: hypothetical protein [Caudoviricetes sp.]
MKIPNNINVEALYLRSVALQVCLCILDNQRY